jgi:hypothetical protein
LIVFIILRNKQKKQTTSCPLLHSKVKGLYARNFGAYSR